MKSQTSLARITWGREGQIS